MSDVNNKKKDWWHWKIDIYWYIYSVYFFCFSQVNSSIHVNSVGVPDNDLMATNGVIHVVKNVLYPAGEHNIHYHTFMQSTHHAESHYIMFSWWCILLTDLPVGRQDLLVLLKKLIKYIQIKVEKEKAHVCEYVQLTFSTLFVFGLTFSILLCLLLYSLFLDFHILRSHSLSSVSFLSDSIATWPVNIIASATTLNIICYFTERTVTTTQYSETGRITFINHMIKRLH